MLFYNFPLNTSPVLITWALLHLLIQNYKMKWWARPFYAFWDWDEDFCILVSKFETETETLEINLKFWYWDWDQSLAHLWWSSKGKGGGGGGGKKCWKKKFALKCFSGKTKCFRLRLPHIHFKSSTFCYFIIFHWTLPQF